MNLRGCIYYHRIKFVAFSTRVSLKADMKMDGFLVKYLYKKVCQNPKSNFMANIKTLDLGMENMKLVPTFNYIHVLKF